jgi:hypothetical protein
VVYGPGKPCVCIVKERTESVPGDDTVLPAVRALPRAIPVPDGTANRVCSFSRRTSDDGRAGGGGGLYFGGPLFSRYSYGSHNEWLGG